MGLLGKVLYKITATGELVWTDVEIKGAVTSTNPEDFGLAPYTEILLVIQNFQAGSVYVKGVLNAQS